MFSKRWRQNLARLSPRCPPSCPPSLADSLAKSVPNFRRSKKMFSVSYVVPFRVVFSARPKHYIGKRPKRAEPRAQPYPETYHGTAPHCVGFCAPQSPAGRCTFCRTLYGALSSMWCGGFCVCLWRCASCRIYFIILIFCIHLWPTQFQLSFNGLRKHQAVRNIANRF